MAHYYTNNVDLDSHQTQIPFEYRGHTITYISDKGVFAKGHIDYGTRVLLSCMDIQAHQKTLLDVGCGYGTIGIALKTVYPWLHVDMVDVNERAVNLANQSVYSNALTNIHAYLSFAYQNVSGCFDLIISNPPIRAGKKVVFEILEKAYEHLAMHGELWIVIQKKQGAPSAQKRMAEVFGNCEIVKRDKGYFVLKSTKQH